MLNPGDRVSHRFNPDLGPGVVAEIRGKNIAVDFPDRGERLHFAVGTDALEPLVLAPGARARLGATGETVVVESMAGGLCRLADGREVPAEELWPLPVELPPEERLARGRLDGFEDLVNRLDGLRLLRLREASGLGSFLGGRVQLFPHQLYAAERACASDPVRWLLADEVGLGKTVEACLILARLLHTRRAERVLVVAPETLTLQWLGELWRKYHQAFALLDDKRLADVSRDHGADANPFDVHRRAVLGLETLVARPRLTERAVAAGIDLLVVDEAHHLRRPPGHPGNPAWRAVAPIAALGRHVLLLSATPLEDDAHGFFRLLQLLRPEEFPEEGGFEARLARREPLPPCTSAARRADIGGLPPRLPAPVEVTGTSETTAGWQALDRLIEHLRAQPAGDALARRKKAERVAWALSSPVALAAGLDRAEREDPALATLIEEARRSDPRVAWLVGEAGRWTQAGEKTLVFVAHRETLEELKRAVELSARGRVGIFHEELSPERRDIEVAQFRLPDGPALLIATECGGEGRNFQFCRRLVLFDLPWNPTTVEQRIGRLDRIGRTIPTEIVYFRPETWLGRAVAEFYERVGIFEEPLGGLERELRHAARALEEVAVAGPGEVSPDDFAAVLAEAREAQDRVRQAAYHELHRDPYRAEMGPAILARVPPDLDAVTEDVVVRAVSRFGFDVEPQRGRRTFRIEFGYEAFLDHLPGVPPGAAFLGTFDREEAVDDEALDFFASGHPLVEGVLTELEEGPRGRVAAFQIAGAEDLFALLALYKRGAEIVAVVVDSAGRPRHDLAEKLLAAPIRPEPVEIRKWTAQAGWEKTIRRIAKALPQDETPQALAAFRVRKIAPRAKS